MNIEVITNFFLKNHLSDSTYSLHLTEFIVVLFPAATCPADTVPSNLINPATVSPTTAVNYLAYVNLTCDVPGQGQELKQRQCLYDQSTNTYMLQGPPYECGSKCQDHSLTDD